MFLRLCESAVAGSAGAAVHGTGASTVEGENAETLEVTPPAGDAVEAETGSTPTTRRSQTGKKTKATMKKAKRRQHAIGCWAAERFELFVPAVLLDLLRWSSIPSIQYPGSRGLCCVLFLVLEEQFLRFWGSARRHSRNGDGKPPGTRASATGRRRDA